MISTGFMFEKSNIRVNPNGLLNIVSGITSSPRDGIFSISDALKLCKSIKVLPVLPEGTSKITDVRITVQGTLAGRSIPRALNVNNGVIKNSTGIRTEKNTFSFSIKPDIALLPEGNRSVQKHIENMLRGGRSSMMNRLNTPQPTSKYHQQLSSDASMRPILESAKHIGIFLNLITLKRLAERGTVGQTNQGRITYAISDPAGSIFNISSIQQMEEELRGWIQELRSSFGTVLGTPDLKTAVIGLYDTLYQNVSAANATFTADISSSLIEDYITPCRVFLDDSSEITPGMFKILSKMGTEDNEKRIAFSVRMKTPESLVSELKRALLKHTSPESSFQDSIVSNFFIDTLLDPEEELSKDSDITGVLDGVVEELSALTVSKTGNPVLRSTVFRNPAELLRLVMYKLEEMTSTADSSKSLYEIPITEQVALHPAIITDRVAASHSEYAFFYIKYDPERNVYVLCFKIGTAAAQNETDIIKFLSQLGNRNSVYVFRPDKDGYFEASSKMKSLELYMNGLLAQWKSTLGKLTEALPLILGCFQRRHIKAGRRSISPDTGFFSTLDRLFAGTPFMKLVKSPETEETVPAYRVLLNILSEEEVQALRRVYQKEGSDSPFVSSEYNHKVPSGSQQAVHHNRKQKDESFEVQSLIEISAILKTVAVSAILSSYTPIGTFEMASGIVSDKLLQKWVQAYKDGNDKLFQQTLYDICKQICTEAENNLRLVGGVMTESESGLVFPETAARNAHDFKMDALTRMFPKRINGERGMLQVPDGVSEKNHFREFLFEMRPNNDSYYADLIKNYPDIFEPLLAYVRKQVSSHI